ncbi:MAG: hypothetical protein ACI4UM_08190 [Succinivibrio sp.]
MSKVYCIAYSNFGYFLSDLKWSVTKNDLSPILYGLYEDELTCGDFVICRRYLSGNASLPDSDSDCDESDRDEILELPEEIERVKITYKGCKVLVIGTYEFDSLFGDLQKDEYGLVYVEESLVDCRRADPENLSEDIVMLALGSSDLDNLFE